MLRPHLRLVLAATASLAALSGCERDDIRSYTIAKEQAASNTASLMAPPAAAISVTWTVPPTWKEVATEEPMRLATFAAGDEQISISAFPGDVGGVTANVNRWRGQLSLPPAEEKDILPTLNTQTVEGVSVSTMRLVGGSGTDMLAAIITPGDGKTWFVKCMTSVEAATKLEAEFVTFCRSFRLSGAPSAQARPAPAIPAPSGAPMPPDHPSIDSAGTLPTPAPVPNSPMLTRLSAWTAPATWKAAPDPSGIAAAVFEVPGTDGAARVTLTSLLGDGGGALSNINRWRNQLGLQPVANLAAQPSTDLGNGAILVELADAAGARAMSAAMITEGSQTWFFKLNGPAGAVAGAKEPFAAFVREVGIGGAAK